MRRKKSDCKELKSLDIPWTDRSSLVRNIYRWENGQRCANLATAFVVVVARDRHGQPNTVSPMRQEMLAAMSGLLPTACGGRGSSSGGFLTVATARVIIGIAVGVSDEFSMGVQQQSSVVDVQLQPLCDIPIWVYWMDSLFGGTIPTLIHLR